MSGASERRTAAPQTRRARPGVVSLIIAACLALALTTLVMAPAQAHGAAPARPAAAAHALPVSYDPPENAVLHTPPTQVRITFNELLAPDLSEIVVVNPSNQEVDNHDSRISADGYSMTVTLPLLPAGTYVVFWRSHSAEDGHVASGSYLFHITRADGTVPAFTGPLPSGTFAGGAGLANQAPLSGPTLASALVRWIALLAITLLLGMIYWSLFVQPRQRLGAGAAALRAGVRARMRQVAWWALWMLLAATLAETAAQAWLLGGSARGVISPPLLESILLTSRFGEAITLRIILTLIGLLTLWLTRPRQQTGAGTGGPASLFDPRVSLIAFGVFIALAYEFSGHGGSANVWWGSAIDFLHLIANGVWLGGLLTLALVIVPVLHGAEGATRRRYLAASIPAFSFPALIAVAALIVTGPLNATTRLTSVAQVWTTAYGVTLIIKSALFLGMVAISFYHAFVLRPLLSDADASARAVADIALPGWANRALQRVQARVARRMLAGVASGASGAVRAVELAGARATTPGEPRASGASVPDDEPGEQTAGMQAQAEEQREAQRQDGRQDGRGDAMRAQVERVERAMMRWWRIEATLGAGILLCAALLGPLAGTLEASSATTASFGATGGVQTLTQQVDGLTVSMNVNPGKFGTNTFTVTIKDPNGAPANGASVFIVSSMVEMDMGDNTINLTPIGAPGVYSGQGELAMAGHWRLRTVIRTREDPNHLHTTTFTIGASY